MSERSVARRAAPTSGKNMPETNDTGSISGSADAKDRRQAA